MSAQRSEPYRVSSIATRPCTLSLLSFLMVFPPHIRANIGLWFGPKSFNFTQCLVFQGEGLGRTLTRLVKSPYGPRFCATYEEA
jgi:hypothetical protein